MRLFTGKFNALEEHFLNFISSGKDNPLDKALIVLPSQRLQNSFKKALAQRNGYITGLSFSNFSALSAAINTSIKEDSKPLLPAGPVQDFIIKDILKNYGRFTPSRGYCHVLKSAFRDLISAEVSVEDLINLKQSDEFPLPGQQAVFEDFIFCYKEYLSKIQKDGFDTYGEFLKKAAENAKRSRYLKSFKYIIFYGFYDLTALQYNLFKDICQNFDVSVYFPYDDTPAYGFIKNFYEAYIYPLAQNAEKLSSEQTPISQAAENIFKPENPKTDNAKLRFISVSGVSAEVQAAAKEILILKEKHNIPFNKIALFARSMEPYKYDIPAIFAQNKIPVNYSFEFPLFSHPLAAFIYNLLSLGRNDFYSADVSSVLTSPYFTDAQNNWRDIINNSAITGGLSQWDSLADLYIHGKDEESKKIYKQNAAQITKTIKLLSSFYARLEAEGNFKKLAGLAEDFIDTFTIRDISAPEENILQNIKNIIREIAGFEQIRQNAARGEFLEELLWAIKEAVYNKTQTFQDGVEAADIMALRGQQFEAAVFLGMNEGLLPATPAPDPVLKEEYRSILQKIGFLIHNQNERYFEEKLLFTIALCSVNKTASFIFERSGDDGKPKIPSLYLSRLADTAGKNLKNPDLFLSRRESEKLKQWPFELLNLNEVSAYAALNYSGNHQALNIAFNPENRPDTILQKQLESAPFMAFNKPGLNFYDGIIQSENKLYQNIKNKGLSPSSMRLLWLCPASYLFKNIIRANEPANYDRAKIPANTKGTLYHEILQNFYKYISQNNLLDKLFAQGAANILEDFAASYLYPERYKEYGLYPLVWKTLCEEIKQHLRHLVESDIKNLQKDNLKPSFFEYHVEAAPAFGQEKLKLHGEIDRIDINPSNGFCRIVDYKTSKESSSFARAIFLKGLLQPPLYMLMLENSADKNLAGLKPSSTTLLAIEEEGKPEKVFTAADYAALKDDFENAVNYRCQLARTGAFIITPSTAACEYCAFADICRKDHGPSLTRARTSPQAKKIRSINAGK